MVDEMHKLINEYNDSRTKLFEHLSIGDDSWELYNKKMKVLWNKIKIELDDTLSLPLEYVKVIHDIAKEQGDNYYNDYYHFGSLIDTIKLYEQER